MGWAVSRIMGSLSVFPEGWLLCFTQCVYVWKGGVWREHWVGGYWKKDHFLLSFHKDQILHSAIQLVSGEVQVRNLKWLLLILIQICQQHVSKERTSSSFKQSFPCSAKTSECFSGALFAGDQTMALFKCASLTTSNAACSFLIITAHQHHAKLQSRLL